MKRLFITFVLASALLQGQNLGQVARTTAVGTAVDLLFLLAKQAYKKGPPPVAYSFEERAQAFEPVAPPPPVASEQPVVEITANVAAEVKIDGQFAGIVPLAKVNVSPGLHTILVAYPGLEPFKVTIDAVENGKYTFQADLKQNPARPRIAGL